MGAQGAYQPKMTVSGPGRSRGSRDKPSPDPFHVANTRLYDFTLMHGNFQLQL
jgi:hypothetical protein